MKNLIFTLLLAAFTSLSASQIGGLDMGNSPASTENNEEKEYAKLIPYLENSDSGEMYFYLANIYLNGSYEKDIKGEVVEKDTQKAQDWFEKSVDKNFPYAAITLGSLYLYHQDFIIKENNIETAEMYLLKSIDIEIYEAYTALADIYFNYKGDAKKAVGYLFEGTKHNLATAQYGLAVIYNTGLESEGFSVERNDDIAAKYLTDACTNPKQTDMIRKVCQNPSLITKEKIK